MAKIAIVKVRSAHDIEWTLPPVAATLLGAVGLGELRDHLRRATGQPFMPQLTLPYLAALGERYNEERGRSHSFVLLDDHPERIRLDGCDMAWFTAVTPTIQQVYGLSDRARRDGLLTVIGGVHATMMPEEAARHATAVVIGEAEPVVSQILEDYDRRGALRPLYEGGRDNQLVGLPVPRWRAASISDYCPWVVPVQTSRGCRNACTFCSTTRFQGARRRHRPVAEIVEEIKRLQDEGVLTADKTVFFTDNNIVSDSDHRKGERDSRYARSLFEALAPLGIVWTGQGEIGVADEPELVEAMARSGCIELLIGFESLKQDNLPLLGKPCNEVELYARRIETLHRHAIAIIGCFVFGLEEDDADVFERACEFIERHIEIPQVSLLTPFPGTALFRQMQREGRLLHQDWSRYDITNVVFRPRRMSAEELESGYRELCRRLFRPGAILRRAIRHAARPTASANPRLGRAGRFTSVLAPNLVYRRLTEVGRANNNRPGSRLAAGSLRGAPGGDKQPVPSLP